MKDKNSLIKYLKKTGRDSKQILAMFTRLAKTGCFDENYFYFPSGRSDFKYIGYLTKSDLDKLLDLDRRLKQRVSLFEKRVFYHISKDSFYLRSLNNVFRISNHWGYLKKTQFCLDKLLKNDMACKSYGMNGNFNFKYYLVGIFKIN